MWMSSLPLTLSSFDLFPYLLKQEHSIWPNSCTPFNSKWVENLAKQSKVAQLCLTFCNPWAVAYHAPPSMGFSRQEYLSGLPFPSPGDLPDPGIEPRSSAFQADALPSEPPGKPIENLSLCQNLYTVLPWWLSGKESACQCSRQFKSLVWENPTWRGATKSMCINCWACDALEPGSCNYWSPLP